MHVIPGGMPALRTLAGTALTHLILASCISMCLPMLVAQAPRSPDAIGASGVPQFVDPAGPFGTYVSVDGTLRAEGSRYRASFKAAIAEIEVAVPNACEGLSGESVATMQLHYRGARRGGSWLPATGAATPRRGGAQDRLVSFEHPGTTETYQIRQTGIEQSFRFAQAPAGTGDLHLHVAVTGNVTAPATDVSVHQALEFSLDGVRAIRYGEAIAFDRAGQGVDVRTTYDGQGLIELTVPQGFLDTAVYPIVVDPAVGPMFVPANPFNDDLKPDVAYDVEQDLYLLVWQRNLTPSFHGIRGSIYRGDGTPVNSLIPIAEGLDYESPAVAFTHSQNANAFLVVWQQPSGIHGRLVTAATGVTYGNVFSISNPAAGEIDERPSVSGPGEEAMMVAWQRRLPAANQSQVLVKSIWWPNQSNPALIAQSPGQILQSVSSGYVQNIRLARCDVAIDIAGVRWYQNRAVWERFYTSPSPGDTDVRTASFRFKLNLHDYALISVATVPGAGDIGPSEFLPDIGAIASQHDSPNDLQYLIAWQDESDVLAVGYDAIGPISGVLPIASTGAVEGRPAVGAGFCEFTVAYIENQGLNDDDVYATMVNRQGSIGPRRLVDSPGARQNTTRASSRPIVSGLHPRNSSLLVWMGETGGPTLRPDIRARFFEPVNMTIGTFGTACSGPLGELPQTGVDGGLPFAGNDEFRLTISNAPPFSLAALVVGSSAVTVPLPGAPGCFVYASLPSIHIDAVFTNGVGDGSVALPIPCSIPSGSFLAMQWAVYTPGHNAFGWITSNDMNFVWNQ